MPELPEVETIRRSLRPKLINQTIIGAELRVPKMLQPMTVDQLSPQITGKIIQEVDRRGKYLLLKLSDDLILTIHLRMTGQLTVEPREMPEASAIYFKLFLNNGTELRFRDQRKFGKIMIFPTGKMPDSLLKLGPEPLLPEFTPAVFKKVITGRKLAVKKALLNQEIIAGIGNIYADEALFIAGIHPARTLESLDDQEIDRLYRAIRQVLSEGIEHHGTTKRDYRDGDGNPGSYQNKLRVYGNKGTPCPICKTPIAKMTFGGRGTHFCPMCQS